MLCSVQSTKPCGFAYNGFDACFLLRAQTNCTDAGLVALLQRSVKINVASRICKMNPRKLNFRVEYCITKLIAFIYL